MKLDELRKRVDRVDAELLALLNRRMELTIRAIKLKNEIEVPSREAEIISAVRSASQGVLAPDFSEQVFRALLDESKRLQSESLELIGFQGEHGAHSEAAVQRFRPTGAPIPHSEFVEVFEGVESGALDFGVVPVENSVAGNVSQVDDLLIETNLSIIGELVQPIQHCLLALPDADYRDIRVVYSHPQALSQCRGFIKRNRLEPRPFYDTAGAALMLTREKPASTAAIASPLAAQLYNLQILKENIQDIPGNSTRFVVLAKSPAEQEGNRCSIVFTTAHKPGALFKALSAFSEADINMTRIESRPVQGDPGCYAFLVDFLGSQKDPAVEKALTDIRGESETFNLLGCYNRIE